VDYDLTRGGRTGFRRLAPKGPHESNTESESVVEDDAMEEGRAGARLADIERDHILATLASCEGNRTRAANVLGISIRCLRNKLHLYAADGVKVPEPKTGMGQSCD
jgi:DNA-binding NtrC family response regulator